jgi:hypothetical protein
MLISCLDYSSTLKMEATYSFEMLDDFQQTTLCYVLEVRTLLHSQLRVGLVLITRLAHLSKIVPVPELRVVIMQKTV